MQISEITAFLEQAYEVLNQHYFEGVLPPVVITVQSSPKAYGHYTTWDAWREEEKGFREINIGAETLDRPIENTIATLVHEMVHHFCAMTGIKDTSRGGTYHNKRFKAEAEQRDLIIDYDGKIGFSITAPSSTLIDFVAQQGWTGIDLARTGFYGAVGGLGGAGGSDGGSDGGGSDTTAGKKKSSTRKYKCPECGCSVRATKEVHISCLDCNKEMLLEEK